MTHYIGNLAGSSDVRGIRPPDIPGRYGGGGTSGAPIADAISCRCYLGRPPKRPDPLGVRRFHGAEKDHD